MLNVRPSFTIEQDNVVNDASTRVFVLLDCEEGPLDVQIVRSEYEFKTLYQSKAMTQSYVMAVWLLRLGYTLEVYRVHKSENKCSLMLALRDEETFVSYPDELLEGAYDEISNTQGYKLENTEGIRTFGWQITIPKEGFGDKDYIAFTVNSDTQKEMLQMSWLGIAKTTGVIATNATAMQMILSDSTKPYYMTEEDLKNPEKVANCIYDLLCSRGGFLRSVSAKRDEDTWEIEYTIDKPIANVDGSYTIRVYSLRPRLYASSTFDICEDDTLNYDMLCRYIVSGKVLTAYSKYDTNLANIELTITSLGETYVDGERDKTFTLTLNKYGDDDMIIMSETYLLKEHLGLKHYNDLIEAESKIADLTLYSFDLPSGTFGFGRTKDFTEATSDDYINVINLMNDTAEKIDTEFVIDSGITDINVLKMLQNSLTFDNLFITSYDDDMDYSLTSEVMFVGDIYSDNYTLPSYMAFLYKFKQDKAFEGYLDIPYLYNEHQVNNTNKYQINAIEANNYGMKLLNPLAYHNGSEMSLEGVVKIVMLLSKIKRKIKENPTIQTPGLQQIISDAQSEVDTEFNSDVELEVITAVVEERTARIELRTVVNFSYSKKFSLNIKII